MIGRLQLALVMVPVIVVVVVGLFLFLVRSGSAAEPTVGQTASASLVSPGGMPVGTVTFRQAATGVLVMADLKGLEPGGHAFIIHEVGSCTPDFDAAGDHFNPEDAEHGLFIRTGSGTDRAGDTVATCRISMLRRTVPPGLISSPRESFWTAGRGIRCLTRTGRRLWCTRSRTRMGKRSRTRGSGWRAG